MLLVRLELGYDYRLALDEEGRVLLTDQTLLSWRTQPRQLMARIRRGDISFSAISQALAGNHDDVLEEMEQAIVRAAG